MQNDGDDDPLVGHLLDGRFELIERIGRGAMGVVYRAHQAEPARTVAVKVMLPHIAQSDPSFSERFMREASVMARLEHPNTVRVYDYGQADGLLFLAMECIEGRTLKQLMGDGPADPRLVLHVAIGLCGSLQEAHEHGLVHRDLKPANVMIIERDGEPPEVRLLDFGLVKLLDDEATPLTIEGAMVGSPQYMAPEQVRAEGNLDGRADQYAVGMLMFELLTGSRAFPDAATTAQLMYQQVHTPAPRLSEVPGAPEIPVVLHDVVARCLQKDREHRYPDNQTLLSDLEYCVDAIRRLPAHAPDGSTSSPWWRRWWSG